MCISKIIFCPSHVLQRQRVFSATFPPKFDWVRNISETVRCADFRRVYNHRKRFTVPAPFVCDACIDTIIEELQDHQEFFLEEADHNDFDAMMASLLERAANAISSLLVRRDQ
jgi:hypothetical protein